MFPVPKFLILNYSKKRTTRQQSFWALREKVSKWTKLRKKFNKVFEDFAKLARKGIRKLFGVLSKIKNFVDFSHPNKITKQTTSTITITDIFHFHHCILPSSPLSIHHLDNFNLELENVSHLHVQTYLKLYLCM